ncbi:hypothetical protein [Bradyrhizobium sp. SRS-191]|uniref:hypothetical protein n=1 Tax=Bradyrhizobium sp. SRS-191 TaxID=2962606 RepID=UPI00211F2E95|nr:hypothetical protein [Bradyrhizobium sp. SRS-191]
MIESGDANRISLIALRLGCASQVMWVIMTDLVISRPSADGPWDYSYFVAHVIWLAPIAALWIVRRSPSATILLALALSAILVLRLYDCLRVVMYGASVLRKLTEADLGATVIGGLSLVVVFLWSAHVLTTFIFNAVQSIVGVFRNG